MNRKQNTGNPDPQEHYRMNYYQTAIATPGGYAVATAAADKPGLYAASPYAAIPSPYATGQPGLPPGMQHYAAATQQYAMVSQASPYSQHAAAAYYASPSGYAATAGVPLSSLQTIPTSSPQSAYLSAQYPTAVGVQRAMLGPTPVTAAGYGGSPLYATSTYAGLQGVPAHQTSRQAYSMAPVGYATAASLPPSVTSPAYPGATNYGPPY
ncbi:hypothetical protein ACOMHN_010363 [Nucella lapillus]